MDNFSVVYRNPGHWDVMSSTKECQIYSIRGKPGNVTVIDFEQGSLRETTYVTVAEAMADISSKLMFEAV